MKEGIHIQIIRIEDKDYPLQLLKIKNPPKQLYIEGNKEILKDNMIAIIGTRKCSKNGAMLAEKFAKELVQQGLTIVSGMAERHRYMCT